MDVRPPFAVELTTQLGHFNKLKGRPQMRATP